MRTTIEISDELLRKAQAQAAAEGVRLHDLVERGLRLVLGEPARSSSRRVNLPLHHSRRPGVLSAEEVSRAEEQMQCDEDADRVNLV
jgi:hypothetical protein